jgi:hypothetical protein
MSILRPAAVEPAAAERTGDPGRCHACRRTDTPRRKELREGQELYLCVDFRSCNTTSKGTN